MAYLSARRKAVRNVTWGGSATISGTTKALTVPVSRLVQLIAPGPMRVVATTMSAANGTFTFANLAAGQEWILLSIDHTGAYNAVVADRVTT
jgi:hypothetical protein